MRNLLKLSSILMIMIIIMPATLSYGQSFPRVMIISGNVQLSVGDSVQNVAVFQDTGGVEVDTTFTWSVKPDSLGVFNPTGLFTATHEGEGYIFASLDTLTDSVMVKVKADEDNDKPSSGGEFFIEPGDTVIQIGTALQFSAHFRDTSGVVTDTTAQWSLKGQPIGTISDSGLLNAYSPGVVLVKAFLGNREQTAMVTAVDTTVDSSGVNLIKISRVLPGGHVLPGITIEEGSNFVIGGLPFPLNILNGGHIYFPMGCLDEDIQVLMKLPERTTMEQDSVVLADSVVIGVTFEVIVDGKSISPYFFNKPVNVGLIFKRGVLDGLGVSVDDLDMFFSEGGGVFSNTGISNVVVDSSSNRIFGQIEHFSTIIVKDRNTVTLVSVEDNDARQPRQFELQQNYPNPFNPSTDIRFRLARETHVALRIYNVLGQEIRTLIDEPRQAGDYTVSWNGKDNAGRPVASGIYIYKLASEGQTAVRKMALIR